MMAAPPPPPPPPTAAAIRKLHADADAAAATVSATAATADNPLVAAAAAVVVALFDAASTTPTTLCCVVPTSALLAAVARAITPSLPPLSPPPPPNTHNHHPNSGQNRTHAPRVVLSIGSGTGLLEWLLQHHPYLAASGAVLVGVDAHPTNAFMPPARFFSPPRAFRDAPASRVLSGVETNNKDDLPPPPPRTPLLPLLRDSVDTLFASYLRRPSLLLDYLALCPRATRIVLLGPRTEDPMMVMRDCDRDDGRGDSAAAAAAEVRARVEGDLGFRRVRLLHGETRRTRKIRLEREWEEEVVEEEETDDDDLDKKEEEDDELKDKNVVHFREDEAALKPWDMLQVWSRTLPEPHKAQAS
ncbi:hypothetical protein DFJ73DRAFT_797158 [Zopfochytrium polystomum]|nr:hypothetical protein DFJ73DRAFT_797158 [Zopfochytrium polystomum]